MSILEIYWNDEFLVAVMYPRNTTMMSCREGVLAPADSPTAAELRKLPTLLRTVRVDMTPDGPKVVFDPRGDCVLAAFVWYDIELSDLAKKIEELIQETATYIVLNLHDEYIGSVTGIYTRNLADRDGWKSAVVDTATFDNLLAKMERWIRGGQIGKSPAMEFVKKMGGLPQ